MHRERGPGQHFGDAGPPRRVDDGGIHVRHEANGWNGGKRRIRVHGLDRPDRIGSWVVEVEDDERGRTLPHLGQRGRRGPGEGERDAQLCRSSLYLGAEHEVVEDGKDHDPTMIVESRAVGPFMKNGFIVACEDTREAVFIDPGDEVEDLLAFVRQQRLKVRHILLTHAHVDHVTGVAAAKSALGVPVYLHHDDQFLYDHAVESGAMFGLEVQPQPPIDAYYTPGQVIPFGKFEVRPHHTPGHCPGGVCLQIGRPGETGLELFVGDTLFAGSIGRTDLPGGDYATLISSIRTVLFGFGDEAVVHPGHGPDTTIGRERRTNPFLVGQD